MTKDPVAQDRAVPDAVTALLPVQGEAGLVETLRALADAQDDLGVDLELVVVDDASSDGAAAVLPHVSGDVTTVRHGRARGARHCLREAVALSSTPLVLALSPSVRVGGTWLSDLCATLPRAGGPVAVQWVQGQVLPLADPRLDESELARGPVLTSRCEAARVLEDTSAGVSVEPAATGEPVVPAAAAGPSAPPLRVLLVPNAFPPSSHGGVETYVTLLAQGLQRRGLHPVVLHPHRDLAQPDYAVETDVVEGIDVVRVNRPQNLWHQEYGDERFEALFAGVVRDLGIDVVHFHHLCDGLSPSLIEVARHAGAATVLTLHDGYVSCAKGHAVDAQGRPCSGAESTDKCVRCLAGPSADGPVLVQIRHRADVRNRVMSDAVVQADLVTAPSRYVAELTRAAPWARGLDVVVRPLGLDVQELERSRRPVRTRRPGEPLNVVVMGNVRVHPSGTDTKGGVLVAQAAAELPHVRFHVHGGVDEAFTTVLSRSPNVTVHGPYCPRDRADVLAGADVLLVASPVESFCFVVREALVLGVPVVSSDGGALPEAVRDGVDGLLFRAADPADLVRVLRTVDADDVLRRRLASAPRTFWSQDEDAQAWAQTYTDLRAVPVAATGPGLAVVVVDDGRPGAVAVTTAALELQTAPAQRFTVSVVPDRGVGAAWSAGASTGAGAVLVLRAGESPDQRLVAAHLAAHDAGAQAAVGWTALTAEDLASAVARAWLRSAPGVHDGTEVADGDVVTDPLVTLHQGSLSHELLASLDPATAGTAAELAARLHTRDVPARFVRAARRVVTDVPDARQLGALLHAHGRETAAVLRSSPDGDLTRSWGLDDVAGRAERSAAELAQAGPVLQRLAGHPLSHLRATPVGTGHGHAVPAADLLAGALDTAVERERLHGVAAATTVAVPIG